MKILAAASLAVDLLVSVFGGATPLPMLETKIDRWLEAQL
jgi:hypothetical protein